MSTPRTRIRPARIIARALGHRAGPSGPPYVIEQETQHWRRIGDRWYRDVIVRRADGERRLFLFPEDVAA